MDRKRIEITVEDILRMFKGGRIHSNYDVGVTEFCPYGEGRRIDVFYFNRWNRITRGYEIKISRSDFLRDGKWKNYLKFCRYFYLVAPQGMIKPPEVPQGIGLIEISLDSDKFCNSTMDDEDAKRYYLTSNLTKRPKKLPEISESDYIRILEGLLIKLAWEKNLIR